MMTKIVRKQKTDTLLVSILYLLMIFFMKFLSSQPFERIFIMSLCTHDYTRLKSFIESLTVFPSYVSTKPFRTPYPPENVFYGKKIFLCMQVSRERLLKCLGDCVCR